MTRPAHNLEEILVTGALELGLALDAAMVRAFMEYLLELKKWNPKVNLTAIRKDVDIVKRHFLDSLVAWQWVEGLAGSAAPRVLDIGAGGGFPGIPLKISLPAIDLVLMDSVGKKVAFMRAAIRRLGLAHVEAISARAEEPAIIARLGPTFDLVLTRAFGDLDEIARLSLPYLKDGGRIIAYKGPSTKGLEDEARATAKANALELKGLFEMAVPMGSHHTTLVVMQQYRP